MVRQDHGAELSACIRHDGGRVQRAQLVARGNAKGFFFERRCEVNQVVRTNSLAVKPQWLRRPWLGWRGPLTRHIGLRNRAFFNGPHRLARHAVENKSVSLFGDLRDGFHLFPGNRYIQKDRRCRDIPVPHIMVDQLVVPDPFTGLRIETHEAIGEEVVAEVGPPVEITGWHFHRNIDIAEFEISAERGPGTGVAAILPGIVFPGLIADLAGPGDGLKGPVLLAGANIETANIAGNIFFAGGGSTGQQRCANNHRILHDDGGRAGADDTGLHDGAIQTFGEIDPAIGPERWYLVAVLRVQRHQLETR